MPRAMWKACLELGRVQLPVKLYAAVEDRGVHFRLLHEKDGVPVRQRMVDPQSGEEVASDEIRRGVEVEEGVLVVIEPEELETIQPEASRSIEVLRVVPRGAVDVAWYDRPYFLGPDGASADYLALVQALEDGGKLGIARWVMRGRQRFGALEPRGGALALISLHPASEVVPADSLARPSGPAVSAGERKLGEQLVAALEGHFDPRELKDEYRERVEKLVAARQRGRRFEVKEAAPPSAGGNLGQALRRSLDAARKRDRAAA